MHTSWRHGLIAAACLAGALWDAMPAAAAGGAPPAGGALQPFNTPAEGADIGNHPTVPPEMFAALEDLSKKSIAESKPSGKQPSQTAKQPAGPGKTNQPVAAPPVQQRKSNPEQPTANRGRRPAGPASRIEALRERLQQGPGAGRRRGFRRAA